MNILKNISSSLHLTKKMEFQHYNAQGLKLFLNIHLGTGFYKSFLSMLIYPTNQLIKV